MSIAAPLVDSRPARVLPIAALAAAAGFLAVANLKLAVVVALVPLAIACLLAPQWSAVAAIVALPFMHDLVGQTFSNFHLSLSDVLATLAIVGLFPLLLLDEHWRARVGDVRPQLIWCAPFVLWLLILLPWHATTHSLLNTEQALQIVLLPLIFGACVFDRKHAVAALW